MKGSLKTIATILADNERKPKKIATILVGTT